MREVVVVSATRTPIGDFGGSLKDVSATSLAMAVIDSSIQQASSHEQTLGTPDPVGEGGSRKRQVY